MTITVRDELSKNTLPLKCCKGDTVFSILRKNSYYIGGVCGGKGTCGKCRIQTEEGVFEITSADRRCLSPKELSEGWRLACTAVITRDCEIGIPEVGDIKNSEPLISCIGADKASGALSIAIDLGTTTIAAALLRDSKGVIARSSAANNQRLYGADVISRIDSGSPEVLQKIVIDDITKLIASLLRKCPVNRGDISFISLSCNTVMAHLLLGYPAETLGYYPFTPFSTEAVFKSFEEIFKSDFLSCPVYIFPQHSAFIGGDVISGLYALDIFERNEISLFIDLGTNAELALGNKDKILCCSAAAGPAFEGGNIKNGTGYITGAVCGVSISSSSAGGSSAYRVDVRTIDDAPPNRICGTGIIEATAEMLKNHIINETGEMNEKFFPKFVLAGETAVYQKDIREVQSAKSAIRAGIEILLKEYGLTAERVSCLYLSGGFKCNPEKAAAIGLFPKAFIRNGSQGGSVAYAGNTSLGGACKYCLQNRGKAHGLQTNVGIIEEIPLAAHPDFEKYFIKYMDFED